MVLLAMSATAFMPTSGESVIKSFRDRTNGGEIRPKLR